MKPYFLGLFTVLALSGCFMPSPFRSLSSMQSTGGAPTPTIPEAPPRSVQGMAPPGYNDALTDWGRQYNEYRALPIFGYKAFASTGDPRQGQLDSRAVGVDRSNQASIPTGYAIGSSNQNEASARAIANCNAAAARLSQLSNTCIIINMNNVDLNGSFN